MASALAGLALSAIPGATRSAHAAELVPQDQTAITAELRRDTQMLLDAIAPGDVGVWDRLIDPAALQVDENDVVRVKSQILAELKPLRPGLAGHLAIDDFRVVVSGDVAIVTHEDNETLEFYGQFIRSRFRMTDTWHKTPDGWRQLASQVLAVLQDPPSVSLDRATLCGYAGQYALTNAIVANIRCTSDKLIVERAGRPERTFVAEMKDVFFEPGQPRTRRIFLRDVHGRVAAFVDRREARDVLWKRTS
jgi:ketosteroid isomerase-like protein